MANKTIAALLVVGLVTVGPSSLGAPKKPISETYDVQAVPFPLHVGERNGAWGCLGGEEGIHKISRPFKAPWSGRLEATVHDFSGDWDIYLTDNRGSMLNYANAGVSQLALGEPDTLISYLAAGQQVNVVACNYAGGPTAQVTYAYDYEKRPVSRPPRKKVVHTERAEYSAPAAATGHPAHLWVTCIGSISCDEWPTRSTDRFVSIEVDDASGQPVSVDVYQYSGIGYRTDVICGETKEPIELVPGAVGVGFSVQLGPCQDGTPTGPTSGEVVATFSSRKT